MPELNIINHITWKFIRILILVLTKYAKKIFYGQKRKSLLLISTLKSLLLMLKVQIIMFPRKEILSRNLLKERALDTWPSCLVQPLKWLLLEHDSSKEPSSLG